ncbi:MAG: hypothetical protein ACFFC7_16255, partial [Candidatus Hermodarchaeota archaeon]
MLPSNSIMKLQKQYGYSWETVSRWIRFFGEKKTKEVMLNNETPVTPVIRVNSLKWFEKPEKLIEVLSKKGLDFNNAQDISSYTYCLKTD